MYNDVFGTGQPRSPLSIALSLDQGDTWPIKRVLQLHDDNSSAVGEYSYPSLLQTADGLIHVTYTYDRCVGRTGVLHVTTGVGRAS